VLESAVISPRSPREVARVLPRAPSSAPEHRSARVEGFVRQHIRFVWRLARHWGLSHEDADDVAQTVMITAVRLFDAIEPGRERAYLYRVTRNHARKAYRTRERRREEVTEDFSLRPAPEPQPEALLERRRAYDELCRILGRLPEKLREVFVLFELEGWTQSEISAGLGIAQGTVASRLRRARERFQRLAGFLITPPSGGRDE
jgi:RNA polymerase sigma-70 factor, ECF subfamily